MGSLLWSILLLAAALLVIGVELFVPSAGLLAILSAGLLTSAVVVAFVHSVPAGVSMIGAIALLLPFIFMLFVKIWPSTPIGRRVLISRKHYEDVLPTGREYEEREELVGQRGIARSQMLPSGQVVIDGQKYDAVSQGMAIEPGDPIEVVAIRTYKIIVRRLGQDELDNDRPVSDADDLLSRPVDDFLD